MKYSFTVQKLGQIGKPGTLLFFLLSSVVKHPNFERTLWVKQILAMSKKNKGGASMLSQTRVPSQIIKTIEGGTFGEKKLRKKVSQSRKN